MVSLYNPFNTGQKEKSELLWRLMAINRIFTVLIIFVGIICKDPESDKNKTHRSVIVLPEIIVTIQSVKIIKVNIKIPRGHHAYLDRGRDGYLIPISFDWKPLKKNGMTKNPILKMKPNGEYDTKNRATVLRGNGVYIFKSRKEPFPEGGKFRVRSQICDERLGQCYPPVFQEVKITAPSHLTR